MKNQGNIEVRNLTKHYSITTGMLFQKTIGKIKAVDNISFTIKSGETLGLIGESNSGKSTMTKILLGHKSPTSGSISFDDETFVRLGTKEFHAFQEKIQGISKESFRFLNPRKNIKQIISEPLLANKTEDKESRIIELMELVGIDRELSECYPRDLSDGQCQRIAIAKALSLNPKMLVLDEPVVALDVSVRAQILNLLKDIQKKLDLIYLFISQNLATIEHVSTTIGVMYFGKLVELAPADKLLSSPTHPYTKALIECVPVADPEITKEYSLKGEAPSPINAPSGCSFHPRCADCIDECEMSDPVIREISDRHFVACF